MSVYVNGTIQLFFEAFSVIRGIAMGMWLYTLLQLAEVGACAGAIYGVKSKRPQLLLAYLIYTALNSVYSQFIGLPRVYSGRCSSANVDYSAANTTYELNQKVTECKLGKWDKLL